MQKVELYGNIYSVYARSVRMALHLKAVSYSIKFVDPFDVSSSADLQRLHPFARVPVLKVDGTEVYETQAILDYVDASFEGPSLRPVHSLARARMRQVMCMTDAYFYWPLVRQVVSQEIFMPLEGQLPDTEEVATGLAAAPRVLDALDTVAREGHVLQPDDIGLAECHLWPMIDYALMVPALSELVALRHSLSKWADAMATVPAAVETKPDLNALRENTNG
jgi:glutathione S-transferase